MKCSKCQLDNPEDAKFCNECGNELEPACPECGKVNPPGSKFCNECGHNLGKPKETHPIDYSKPQSYTPQFLAEKILTNRRYIEGERKLVTVLFADVVNYTALSEKLDPEEVHQIMDGCLKILMDEVHKYEGTINQFTGDGVMALFGAPVAHEDHAQRACHAAVSIQKAMGEYGEKVKSKWGHDFRIRVGLNSGSVRVGSIGDDLRMDYTAVGDTTNLASRMESMAKPGTCLVSGPTYKLAKDYFEFQPLGTVKVKGRQAPVETYELNKASGVGTRIEAAVVKGLTRFVGRKKEINGLKEAYDKAQAGLGQVVGIVGEAGVGKSRIIFELREMLPAGQFTYLEGRCLHYGGSMAYLPILDILRSYFDFKEGEREHIIKEKMKEKVLVLDAEISRILPPLQDLLSLKVEDETYLNLEPKEKKGKTFEAIRDLLIKESGIKPLVLAVEDLHWIDKTSEEFLDYFIGWLASTRILLIILYRPEYSHPWGSKSYYSKIRVDQLSPRSSTELVQSILEGADVSSELRRLIAGRTGGNPLFIEELTHTLMENGSIQRKDDKYILARESSIDQVPSTIQGIIAARLDRLEESLKRITQVASVIGRDFAFRILQTITGMREELKPHLLSLQELEFIYEKSLIPELEYIFKHALTQEVAYNSLLLKRRKEIHEQVGRAIEEIYAERTEEFYEMLAYHFSKGENLEKAYKYLKLSGDKAARNHSNWEAFRFYKEAIDALNQLPRTEENEREQIEVRLLISTPMLFLNYPEGSLEILQEGERYAKDIADEKSLSIFYSKLGSYYAVKGEPVLSREYTEKRFQEAERTQDIELMAPIACELCISYLVPGEYSNILDVAPKVLGLLEEGKRELDFFGIRYNVYSGLCAWCGYALGALGDFAHGKALLEKGLRFALQTNNPYGLGWLELCYGQLCVFMGDGKSAIEHFQKSIMYLEESQAFFILGLGWAGLGFGHYLMGEMTAALGHLNKGLKIQNDMGIAIRLSDIYLHLSMVYSDTGDLKNAQSCAGEALRLSQKNNEKDIEGITMCFMGRLLGKSDPSQTAKSVESIQRGIDILDGLKMKPWYSMGHLFLGELYVHTGQRAKALENLEMAARMYREMGMDYYVKKTQEVLGTL